MAKLKEILYEPYRHWAEKGTIWLFSDPHFEDADCALMDPNWITPEEQVKLINSCVGKTDTLIILGDIGKTKYIPQLKGYKVLIAGNHDAGLSNYKRRIWTEPFTLDCRLRKHYLFKTEFHSFRDEVLAHFDNKMFDEVYGGPVFIAEKILLSHEPIDYPYALNIHGHDHANWCNLAHHYNVCANVIDYKPVRLTQLIDAGLLSDIDSIHRATIDKAIQRKKERVD